MVSVKLSYSSSETLSHSAQTTSVPFKHSSKNYNEGEGFLVSMSKSEMENNHLLWLHHTIVKITQALCD